MTHVPVERRGFALGVWAGVSGSALAAGPLIGALLTEAFGWRSIFLINAPVSGLLVLLALRTLPSWPQPKRRHRLDVKGTITSAIALTAGVFGLTQSNTYGWASLRLWAILAVGAAASILFVRVEGRAANPLVELSLFRLPNFLAANVLALLSLAIMCSLFFFLSLYLQQALQLSAITAGWALLPFTAVIAVIAPLAGWLTDRTGPRALIAIGLLLVALGLLLLSRMDAGTEAGDLVPGLLTTGLGLGLSSAPVTTAALLAVPQRSAGMAAAIVSVSRLIGLAVGVAAMGAIVSLSWPTGVGTTVVERQELAAAFGTGFAVNAILALAGAVAGLFAIRSGPVQPAKSPGVGGQLRGD